MNPSALRESLPIVCTTTDRLWCHLRFGGALRPAQCLKFYALFLFGILETSGIIFAPQPVFNP